MCFSIRFPTDLICDALEHLYRACSLGQTVILIVRDGPPGEGLCALSVHPLACVYAGESEPESGGSPRPGVGRCVPVPCVPSPIGR